MPACPLIQRQTPAEIPVVCQTPPAVPGPGSFTDLPGPGVAPYLFAAWGYHQKVSILIYFVSVFPRSRETAVFKNCFGPIKKQTQGSQNG